jgi:hypothetical protein
LNSPVARPELMDAVAERIGLGASQLMTEISEPLYSHNALVLHLPFLAIEPIENRASAIGLGEKHDLDPRHPVLLDARIA